MSEKYCEQCGKLMVQPRWKNGKKDSTFQKRRFCSSRCYGDWVMEQNKSLTKAASRKRAQRVHTKMKKCSECGSTENLQRHHEDHQDACSVDILCQNCHTKREMELGRWGRSATSA